MTEKIIETKQCKHCNSNFTITDKELKFYKKISPKFEDRKYSIPTPTLCPECRQQRRLSFRNERNLYKRKCDATGKGIISIYSPDKNITVYNSDFWWSDAWSPLDYGMEFDFEKSFFNQFKQLGSEVPAQAVNNKFCEDSPYINDCVNCNNSHLLFNSIHSKNSLHSYILRHGDNCVDTAYCDKCFDSYELTECGGNSHNLFFSFKTSKCQNSYYLHSCFKCEECIGCINLIDKKYCIFNKQYSQEKYEIKKKKLFQKGHKYISREYNEIISKSFRSHMIGYANEEVYGDNTFFSKNCSDCYDSNSLEDCKYIYTGMQITDSHDIYLFGKDLKLSYEASAVGENSTSLLFCNSCTINCYNLLYCQNITSCKNCFGSVGLRNKQYCILNKQYTKEEYNKLVPKIIKKMHSDGEWGEFFPASLSPFGYNETVAQDYFLLTKKEALKKGFNWSDYEAPKPNVEKIIPASKLPENIKDIPDDILNWAIECEVTKKPFRVIPQELEFYRKHNLPVPKRHPDQRHLDRMKLRNPRKLFDRNCDKCGVNMKTTYTPEREEVVYCEDCYNRKVY